MDSLEKFKIVFFPAALKFIFVVAFLFTLHVDAHAQKENERLLPEFQSDQSLEDSLVSFSDSTIQEITTDTLAPIQDKESEWGIKFSKEALPEVVKTSARDSMIIDMKDNVFYLYGQANAEYDGLTIKGGKIVYAQKTSILKSSPLTDTAGKKISIQEFQQGGEQFTFDTLQYNFESKRAVVNNARSQYGEGFVISEQIKRNPDESLYGWKNLYTTCNLDHPHFGIRTNRIKIVPGKIIATGPANLEIQDVPTPLGVPFGLFPAKQGQKSGFILPSYTIEERRGLGLQRGGYYFALSDHLGVITQFDMFSKGSWGAFSSAQYAKRYLYSGNLDFNYSYTKIGESYEPDGSVSKDFRLNWSHAVDPRARPGTTFSASVNLGTSSFNRLNGIDVYNALDNQYSSSISFRKSWVGKPYSLTAALRHSQSTQSHQVTVGLPEINFNLGQFSPFQRKEMVGSPKWYEKISFSYSVTLLNNWNFIDSTLNMGDIKFSDFDNGIRHTANLQTNYNILRYFTWNITVPYTEYWNTKQVFLNYDQQSQEVDTVTNMGFHATRDFNVTTSLSTRIYGMKMFKKGKISGVRHVISPSISATYQPGFAHSPFGYMYENQWDPTQNVSYESPYRFSPVGGPSNPNNSGNIGFSLDNTLQMKVRTDDSVGSKNVSLIDGLKLTAGYDMFADSFNMSNIQLNFKTSILNSLNISASTTFDPYVYDENGRRTSAYLIDNGEGLAKFRNGNLSLGVVFQGKRRESVDFDDESEKNDQVALLLRDNGVSKYHDFNIPWDLNLNGGISAFRQNRKGQPDTLIFRPNLMFNGGITLTERWKIHVSGGLEFVGFKEVRMGTTNIEISRDLHCWQMNLSLVPFGYYRSFNFTLQVKASVLQDLKLTRRRAFQDNF